MVFCLGTFCDESTLGLLCFFWCSGSSPRYPAVGFLSFSSQIVVFNECTHYDFLLGDIL